MKNKSKTSKKTVLTLGITAVVATFLLLPVFFSDEPSSVLLHAEDEGSGVLPVIASENPLSKYLRQASSFYGFNNERNAFGKGKGMLPPAPQESYSEAQQDAMLAAFAKEKVAALQGADAAQSGDEKRAANTYYAQDGVTVQPDEKGYYYGNQYYKNGTYPNRHIKNSIENSISKFHEAQASKQGKRAVYMLQDDGALIVKYMPKKELENLQAGATLSPMDKNLYASGKKYGNTAEQNRRGASGSYNIGGGVSSGSAASGGRSYGGADMASMYNAAGQRGPSSNNTQGEQTGSNSQNDDGYRPDNNYYSESPRALLNTLDIFDKKRFMIDGTPYRMRYNGEKFDKKHTFVDEKLLNGVLAGLNIGLKDIYVEEGADLQTVRMDSRDPAYMNRYNQNQPLRIFTAEYDENLVNMLISKGALPEQMRPRKEGEAPNPKVGDDTSLSPLYMNFLVPPTARQRRAAETEADEKSFYEIYYRNTRLGTLLERMNVNPDKIAEVKEQYMELDVEREYSHKLLAEMKEKNPSIQNLEPTTVYLLGREGRSVVMATGTSPFYAPHPEMLPQEIYAKFNEGQERGGLPYVSVSEKEVLDILNKKALSVAVIVDSGNSAQTQEVKEYIGQAKVVRVPIERASSGLPDDIRYMGAVVGKARMEAALNFVDYSEKKKMREDFEAIDKDKAKEDARKAAEAVKRTVDDMSASFRAYQSSSARARGVSFADYMKQQKALTSMPGLLPHNPLKINTGEYSYFQNNSSGNMRFNDVTGKIEPLK